MKCHNSHSKKDLSDIIMIFDLPINKDTIKIKTKKDLGEDIMITLKTMDTITPNYDYYEINKLEDLIDFLTGAKKRNNISLKEREIGILKAKSLIHFVKGCGGTFGNSDYTDISQVISDAEFIKKYADVPTCRMSIRLLNESNILNFKIEPELSYRVKKSLEKKQKIKANQQATYSYKIGEFEIRFD